MVKHDSQLMDWYKKESFNLREEKRKLLNGKPTNTREVYRDLIEGASF